MTLRDALARRRRRIERRNETLAEAYLRGLADGEERAHERGVQDGIDATWSWMRDSGYGLVRRDVYGVMEAVYHSVYGMKPYARQN